MSAVVTDQFRISNAANFVDSVLDTNNSYYVFLGLSNPSTPNPGFGRNLSWPENPKDNFQYLSHYKDTSLFGKKINGKNIRRVVPKVTWTSNTRYDMYRHDYSATNLTPNSSTARLYDSQYFVVNSDFNVYICLDNGSSGSFPKGGTSKDEPTFTDLEPTAAGNSGDGYIWKYLFSISPSDVIKFDSTEYIVVPNDWETSTDTQIQNVREAGDSTINFNQIKKVYIENGGIGYNNDNDGTPIVNIVGDGSGAKVSLEITDGVITDATVTAGGSGYSYGMIDLSTLQPTDLDSNPNKAAKLIPIIPPSRGHGYDIYKELGADRVLIYARFDDSTKDFPIDTKFSQVGIIKNPTSFTSQDVIFTASYDSETNVLKYYQDRSLYFNQTNMDHTDYVGLGTVGSILSIESKKSDGSDANSVVLSNNTTSVDASFSGSTLTIGSKEIDLGINFTEGLANPEINRNTGDIIYIDNRRLVTRDGKQKEDVKIILEF